MATTEQPIIRDARAPQGEPPARRGRARWWFLGAVVIAVLVAALALWFAGRDDTRESEPPGVVPTQTTEPSPTSTTPPAGGDATVLWPFPGSTTSFATPVEAARSFATAFLRFEDPVVEPFQQGDARSGEVPIRPTRQGPVTTILVRQVGPGDDWSVLGAVTPNIDVTAPATGGEIASPVRVAGRAVAFEGTVQVEVREDGELGAIGTGFVTGGGDQMRGFTGTVDFETPGAPFGALVFFTESAENGQVWEGAAFRVALRSTDIDAAACGTYRSPRPRPAPGEMEVKAYFGCDADGGGLALHPVYRLVPESPRVLRASLEALLAGPTDAERAASLSSWFSSATTGMLRSVTIADGHAVVDFEDLRPVIPNASTSAGSMLLLSQLDTTVFQFRTVTSVEYRLEGGCEAFNEWLQYGGCDTRTRTEAATD